MSHEFPYRGLKVLDLGQGVASPYCGMLLALYGADVVKVEPPEGDWARNLGGKYDGGRQSAMSLTFNRGKRSLTLDLKSPTARAVLRRMAEQADVLIEGFRPGVADRPGVGYDSLKASGAAFMGHRSPEAMLEAGPLASPNVPAGGYQTKDGWVMVALVTETQFVRWCDAMRRPDLPTDPRFNSFPQRAANEAALLAIICATMLTETSATWLERLRATPTQYPARSPV